MTDLRTIQIPFSAGTSSDVVVTGEHFGYVQTGMFNSNEFMDQYDMLSGQHLRWPGGTLSETNEDVYSLKIDGLFDATQLFNPDPTRFRFDLEDMINAANETGSSLSIIIPTVRYKDNLAEGQQDLQKFLTDLFAGKYGEVPQELTLELGNEYHDVFGGDGAAYGQVANAMLTTIKEVTTDASLNPNGYSPHIAVQMGKYSDQDGLIRDAISEDNLDVIDTLVAHHLPLRFEAIDKVNTSTSIPEEDQGESRPETIEDMYQQWSDEIGQAGGLEQPDLYMSAVTMGSSSQNADNINYAYNDYGLREASAYVEMYSTYMNIGADKIAVWGANVNNPNKISFTDQDGNVELTPGGEALRLMAEALPGTSPIDSPVDNLRSDDFLMYMFEDSTKLVVFLSANDINDGGLDIALDLSGYGTMAYVHATSLTAHLDASYTGDPAAAEARIYEIADVTSDSTLGNFDALTVHLTQDYEMVRLVLTKEQPDAELLERLGDPFPQDDTDGHIFDVALSQDTDIDNIFTYVSEGTEVPEDLREEFAEAPENMFAGAPALTITLPQADGDDGLTDAAFGVYEIDANGAITNVRLLSEDIEADAGRSFDITPPASGNELGYFLVPDDMAKLADLTDADTLSFEATDAGMALHLNGQATRLDTIHSVASANADGQIHTLFGADEDSLTVGFETGADWDFNDVILTVTEGTAPEAEVEVAPMMMAAPTMLTLTEEQLVTEPAPEAEPEAEPVAFAALAEPTEAPAETTVEPATAPETEAPELVINAEPTIVEAAPEAEPVFVSRFFSRWTSLRTRIRRVEEEEQTQTSTSETQETAPETTSAAQETVDPQPVTVAETADEPTVDEAPVAMTFAAPASVEDPTEVTEPEVLDQPEATPTPTLATFQVFEAEPLPEAPAEQAVEDTTEEEPTAEDLAAIFGAPVEETEEEPTVDDLAAIFDVPADEIVEPAPAMETSVQDVMVETTPTEDAPEEAETLDDATIADLEAIFAAPMVAELPAETDVAAEDELLLTDTSATAEPEINAETGLPEVQADPDQAIVDEDAPEEDDDDTSHSGGFSWFGRFMLNLFLG